MLENYLHTPGREWERYAWVKAREISGQPATELMALVTPFVYRRHLDFSAIAVLRELHAQIRAEVARRDLHDNIKLGPGGIREIEFVAQVFQIVRGGSDPGLRLRPTLATLERLAQPRTAAGRCASTSCARAYEFLRNLEHRLQYLDDQQTQMLPANADDLDIVARAMGFADTDALLAPRSSAIVPMSLAISRQCSPARAPTCASIRSADCGWARWTSSKGCPAWRSSVSSNPQRVWQRLRRAARRRRCTVACRPPPSRAWTAWCRGCCELAAALRASRRKRWSAWRRCWKASGGASPIWRCCSSIPPRSSGWLRWRPPARGRRTICRAIRSCWTS